MTKYRAVLFDLDGTLLDTLEDIAGAANRVLSGRGLPTHPISAYRQFVGEGAGVLFSRALPQTHQDEVLVNACVGEFNEDYGRNYMEASKPYPGIPELLSALAARDLKLAVLSNKPDHITKKCVQMLLPNRDFDVVRGQRDSVPRKPHPRGALDISETLKVAPSDFIYIGDTAIDMKTAVSAGMFPVGVLWGFRTLKELRENGALAIVEDPLEILSLL